MSCELMCGFYNAKDNKQKEDVVCARCGYMHIASPALRQISKPA